MNTLQIALPDDVSQRVAELARRQGMSAEEFAAAAVADQIAACDQLASLRERAVRGAHVDFDALLDLAPDAPPEPGDEPSPENAAWANEALRRPPVLP